MTDEDKKPKDCELWSEEDQALADAYAPKRTVVDHDPHTGPNVVLKPLSKEAWDQSYQKQPWNATPQGRLAIRTFSRGIMGAMFFTAGGLWARKLLMAPLSEAQLMLGEAEQLALKEKLKYNSQKSYGEIIDQKNPLQFIAKTIDTFVGKPIESVVNVMGYNGQRAVHFKPTKYSTTYGIGDEKYKMLGRSLGEEAVFTTFDFFCASIGDALGRDIVGWFDPSQKKNWMDDKGHIKWPEAVKSLTSSMFRYVTYNGGEDWAVAIPYVYFVKMQRNCIDKYLSPGYGFESDIALNASSLKMNTSVTPHTVTGSYSLEAMLDYQTRFTVYNMGTLLYRELYDKAEQALKGKHVNLYGSPDAPVDKNRGFMGNALDVVKWGLRGAVKGLIYMTPAVPFFSITRATQGRGRALFIDPNQNAALGFDGVDKKPHYVVVGEARLNPQTGMGEHGITEHTPVFYSRYDPNGNGGRGSIDKISATYDAKIGNPVAREHPKFNEYRRRNNLIENTFSHIGEANSNFANYFGSFADKWKVRELPGAQTPVRDGG